MDIIVIQRNTEPMANAAAPIEKFDDMVLAQGPSSSLPMTELVPDRPSPNTHALGDGQSKEPLYLELLGVKTKENQPSPEKGDHEMDSSLSTYPGHRPRYQPQPHPR